MLASRVRFCRAGSGWAGADIVPCLGTHLCVHMEVQAGGVLHPQQLLRVSLDHPGAEMLGLQVLNPFSELGTTRVLEFRIRQSRGRCCVDLVVCVRSLSVGCGQQCMITPLAVPGGAGRIHNHRTTSGPKITSHQFRSHCATTCVCGKVWKHVLVFRAFWS